MLNKDNTLLERAYLAVGKPVPGIPSDEEPVTGPLSTSPVKELAPNIKFGAPSPELETAGVEGFEADEDPGESAADVLELEEEPAGVEDDNEAHELALDNLNSIRESVTKIAMHCASGACLEAYQQQKLAIAMDNLACIARSIH